MANKQLSLLPFYAGWHAYNQRLVAATAPLTHEQLALRTTPQHWSIGMYVTHIVANRAWWFHARMGAGGDDLTSLELWALGVCEADVGPGHTAAKLVARLVYSNRISITAAKFPRLSASTACQSLRWTKNTKVFGSPLICG